MIVPIATVQLDLVWKIDDPTGGVAIHVIGGAWGTLAAGLFVPAATFGEKLRDLGVQLSAWSSSPRCAVASSLVALRRC